MSGVEQFEKCYSSEGQLLQECVLPAETEQVSVGYSLGHYPSDPDSRCDVALDHASQVLCQMGYPKAFKEVQQLFEGGGPVGVVKLTAVATEAANVFLTLLKQVNKASPIEETTFNTLNLVKDVFHLRGNALEMRLRMLDTAIVKAMQGIPTDTLRQQLSMAYAKLRQLARNGHK